jgi:hypothetical protein
MFEDASSSAASESEIQSDGGFDIGQSCSFEAAPPPLADSVLGAEPEVDSELDAVSELLDDDSPPVSLEPLVAARLDLLLVEERSFLAQPLPLKWTAGAEKARVIGPPHLGHVDGPWPWTECITSIVWPHFEQT